MIKRILISLLILISFGCSPIKKINNNVFSGEFDKAINKTISELQKTKNKKKKIEYESILTDIYDRSVKSSTDKISRLKKDGNPEFFEEIYFEYERLIKRQDKLKNISSERLNFNFENYDSELINYRYKTSDYYLKLAETLISNKNKIDYRDAYNYLSIVESINPNYKNIRSQIDLCLFKGRDNILLSVFNESNSIIFKELEKEILNFNIYDLNSKWRYYYTKKNIIDEEFDFYIDLAFNNFIISPERIIERENTKRKQIVDGFNYQLDSNGNVMKDSLGNDIKIEKIITISAKTVDYNQSKSAKVISEVRYLDNKKNIIDKFPLESEFWFRNIYLEFIGDKRALTKQEIRLSRNKYIPFPSDDIMIYNNSEEIKRKLKNIIRKSFY